MLLKTGHVFREPVAVHVKVILFIHATETSSLQQSSSGYKTRPVARNRLNKKLRQVR